MFTAYTTKETPYDLEELIKAIEVADKEDTQDSSDLLAKVEGLMFMKGKMIDLDEDKDIQRLLKALLASKFDNILEVVLTPTIDRDKTGRTEATQDTESKDTTYDLADQLIKAIEVAETEDTHDLSDLLAKVNGFLTNKIIDIEDKKDIHCTGLLFKTFLESKKDFTDIIKVLLDHTVGDKSAKYDILSWTIQTRNAHIENIRTLLNRWQLELIEIFNANIRQLERLIDYAEHHKDKVDLLPILETTEKEIAAKKAKEALAAKMVAAEKAKEEKMAAAKKARAKEIENTAMVALKNYQKKYPNNYHTFGFGNKSPLPISYSIKTSRPVQITNKK